MEQLANMISVLTPSYSLHLEKGNPTKVDNLKRWTFGRNIVKLLVGHNNLNMFNNFNLVRVINL